MFDYSRHPKFDSHGMELSFCDLPHRIDLTEFENTSDENVTARLAPLIEWCKANLGAESCAVDDNNRWCHMMNALHFRSKQEAMMFKLACGDAHVSV